MTMPLRSRTKNAPGFTLLETMIALAIVAVALVGTLAGFITVDTALRDSQLRQVKMALLDAKSQRMMLENKADLVNMPALWTADPTQSIVNANNTPIARPVPDPDADLSIGAFFSMLPNGEFQQLNLPAGTGCGDPIVPPGTYCREVQVTAGMPNGLSLPPNPAWIALNGSVTPQTYWARIYRRGENPALFAVVYKQVMTQ
jgi:prepilin-type N-terminal cleavage/methylation domain-containing protein